jgi:phosphatidylglycerol:prolipoprotein diacylglycerol transferase
MEPCPRFEPPGRVEEIEMHPILFRIGHYAVHTYSLMLGIAFVGSLALAYRIAKQQAGKPGAIDPNDVLDIGYWMIIWGVIGARLAFVLTPQDWSEYRVHPVQILQIWNGGISFYGALVGGFIALAVVCRRRGIPIMRFGDVIGPPVMLGYAIGRIGCFFNGCCYGRPTTLPWGVRFNDEGYITPPSHPTQIYSSILSFLFLSILLRLTGKKAFDGQILFAYLLLSAIERFIMEIWRGDATSTVIWRHGAIGMTDVQFMCIGLAAVSSVALALLARRARTGAVPPPVLETAAS